MAENTKTTIKTNAVDSPQVANWIAKKSDELIAKHVMSKLGKNITPEMASKEGRLTYMSTPGYDRYMLDDSPLLTIYKATFDWGDEELPVKLNVELTYETH